MGHLSQVIQQVHNQTIWSRWHPLEGCWRGHGLPACGGIYRLRIAGKDDLMYIGSLFDRIRDVFCRAFL